MRVKPAAKLESAENWGLDLSWLNLRFELRSAEARCLTKLENKRFPWPFCLRAERAKAEI